MHKLTINRARLELTLRPVTPLLVKSGDKGAQLLHPERPNMMCVRTKHASLGETVYVPGSSLKGVVRSASERVLRSLGLSCCDPMDHKSRCHDEASRRGDELARRGGESPHPMSEIHKMVCFACRTFGSQALASRTVFADAYPTEATKEHANDTETRNGVSIDRKKGGPVPGSLFEFEVVVGGDFRTSVHLANFELWQLGLLGVVLADIDEGFVRVGSAKSRGLGSMSVSIDSLVVDQIGARGAVAGVAALREDLVEPYGLVETTSVLGPSTEATFSPLGQRFSWKDGNAREALARVAELAWPALLARRGAA